VERLPKFDQLDESSQFINEVTGGIKVIDSVGVEAMFDAIEYYNEKKLLIPKIWSRAKETIYSKLNIEVDLPQHWISTLNVWGHPDEMRIKLIGIVPIDALPDGIEINRKIFGTVGGYQCNMGIHDKSGVVYYDDHRHIMDDLPKGEIFFVISFGY
jgi:hypothetical protein